MPKIMRKDGTGMSVTTAIPYGNTEPTAGLDVRDSYDSGYIEGESPATMDHAGTVESTPASPKPAAKHGQLDTLG